jgi:hypothetical protein
MASIRGAWRLWSELTTPCPRQVIPMAVDARYRDKDGEISRTCGNTLIGTLRMYQRREVERRAGELG